MIWEENKHPRDEEGKFTSSGGTPAEKKRLQQMGIEAEEDNLSAEEKRLKEQGIEANSDKKFKQYFVEKIDRNDKNLVKSKVQEYMDKIVEDNKEHNVVIDRDGNIFERVGEENYVEDMGLDLNGAIDLHNHVEDGSFGEDDFYIFRDKVGTQFVAVSPNFVYKLNVIKEINKPYNYFYINGLVSNSDDQNHGIMELMKSEGYIEYEKILRHS